MYRVAIAVLLFCLAGCGPQPPMDLMREVKSLDDVPWLLETLRGVNVVPLQRSHGEEEDGSWSRDEDEPLSDEQFPENGAPEEIRRISIEFEESDGGWKIHGFSGCNMYSAACSLDGASFSVGPVAATRMFCPDDTLENRYLQVLDQATELHLKRNALFLLDGEEVLATFVPDFR